MAGVRTSVGQEELDRADEEGQEGPWRAGGEQVMQLSPGTASWVCRRTRCRAVVPPISQSVSTLQHVHVLISLVHVIAQPETSVSVKGRESMRTPHQAARTALVQSRNTTPSFHPLLRFPTLKASPGRRLSRSTPIAAAASCISCACAACSAANDSPRAILSDKSVSYSSRAISGAPVLSILPSASPADDIHARTLLMTHPPTRAGSGPIGALCPRCRWGSRRRRRAGPDRSVWQCG